jgi:hypothetical protein
LEGINAPLGERVFSTCRENLLTLLKVGCFKKIFLEKRAGCWRRVLFFVLHSSPAAAALSLSLSQGGE